MMIGIQNVNSVLIMYWCMTLVCLLLFAIYDYIHHMIRNTALIAFLAWCLLYLPIAILLFPDKHPGIICLECLEGVLVGFVLLFLIAFATNGGIGGGDIKLIALLGIPFGAKGILTVLFVSCLLALLFEVIGMCIKRKRPANIPFAPYIFAGSVIVVLYNLLGKGVEL